MSRPHSSSVAKLVAQSELRRHFRSTSNATCAADVVVCRAYDAFKVGDTVRIVEGSPTDADDKLLYVRRVATADGGAVGAMDEIEGALPPSHVVASTEDLISAAIAQEYDGEQMGGAAAAAAGELGGCGAAKLGLGHLIDGQVSERFSPRVAGRCVGSSAEAGLAHHQHPDSMRGRSGSSADVVVGSEGLGGADRFAKPALPQKVVSQGKLAAQARYAAKLAPPPADSPPPASAAPPPPRCPPPPPDSDEAADDNDDDDDDSGDEAGQEEYRLDASDGFAYTHGEFLHAHGGAEALWAAAPRSSASKAAPSVNEDELEALIAAETHRMTPRGGDAATRQLGGAAASPADESLPPLPPKPPPTGGVLALPLTLMRVRGGQATAVGRTVAGGAPAGQPAEAQQDEGEDEDEAKREAPLPPPVPLLEGGGGRPRRMSQSMESMLADAGAAPAALSAPPPPALDGGLGVGPAIAAMVETRDHDRRPRLGSGFGKGAPVVVSGSGHTLLGGETACAAAARDAARAAAAAAALAAAAAHRADARAAVAAATSGLPTPAALLQGWEARTEEGALALARRHRSAGIIVPFAIAKTLRWLPLVDGEVVRPDAPYGEAAPW